MLDEDSLAVTTALYGSWRSPITADLIVGDTVDLPEAWLDGDDVYWCEGRPKEGGRFVVVKYGVHGPAEDVTPPSFNARTRVHEYGGRQSWSEKGQSTSPILPIRNCIANLWANRRKPLAKRRNAVMPMPYSTTPAGG
jgi:hypothetical protein